MADPVQEEPSEISQRPPQGRHDAILDAATSLFAEHGFNDADTQALAERLGVGKGTVYRCFASKRELFLAAADRAMRRLHQRLDQSVQGVDDPLERVSAAVRAYLEFFDANPEYVELLIQERALFKDRKQPTYFEHRDRNADYWRRLYRGLIDAGRIRDLPVDQIRDVMSHALYGAMMTNYFNGRRASNEQAEQILDVMFRGILSDSERNRWSPAGSIERPSAR